MTVTHTPDYFNSPVLLFFGWSGKNLSYSDGQEIQTLFTEILDMPRNLLLQIDVL